MPDATAVLGGIRHGPDLGDRFLPKWPTVQLNTRLPAFGRLSTPPSDFAVPPCCLGWPSAGDGQAVGATPVS